MSSPGQSSAPAWAAWVSEEEAATKERIVEIAVSRRDADPQRGRWSKSLRIERLDEPGETSQYRGVSKGHSHKVSASSRQL